MRAVLNGVGGSSSLIVRARGTSFAMRARSAGNVGGRFADCGPRELARHLPLLKLTAISNKETP
jgi:hypothetical protein